MKGRQLAIVLILLVALGAVALFLNRRNSASWSNTATERDDVEGGIGALARIATLEGRADAEIDVARAQRQRLVGLGRAAVARLEDPRRDLGAQRQGGVLHLVALPVRRNAPSRRQSVVAQDGAAGEQPHEQEAQECIAIVDHDRALPSSLSRG